MAWFKVDDKLHDHRKARQAGRAAMGVWVLAGSWAADNLTDGFVPEALLSRWGTRADAAKLVAVGLWHECEQDGEKGWRFHEWLEFQPSRAKKIAEREARAEAGRIGGKRSGQSRREAKAKQVASPLLEPPSRPVPTRPTSTDVEVSPAVAGTFEDFWSVYPRKVGKGQAVKAWKAATKKADPALLIAAAAEFAKWHANESTDPKFIPYPTTWLNGERWNDERPARVAQKSTADKRVAEALATAARLATGPTPPRPQIGA